MSVYKRALVPTRRALDLIFVAAAVPLAVLVALGAWAQPITEARTFAAGEVSETAILAALARSHPERFRPIGTTSITFQVDLSGPIEAAFKPETRVHPRGWLNEVAAYRVARALGLDDVPPALLRPIERGQIRRRLDPESPIADEDLDGDLTVAGNMVRGAFIYWVPGLLRSDLDTPNGIERWSAWLSQASSVPDDQRAIARDLSNVVVFDYLIGNRDRWSGGNVRPVGERLVIRDHNLAFPVTLGEGPHRRVLSFLVRAQRFSRTTIRRLVALDERALREAVEDSDPESLLDDRQIAGVLQRRAAILSYVGALIEDHGEAAILAFD